MEIEPYLEEYFYDRPEKVEEFRWGEIGDRMFIELKERSRPGSIKSSRISVSGPRPYLNPLIGCFSSQSKYSWGVIF